MPQAPLPAPAARISVPIFQPLNPGTYMERNPFNVLAYMKYPDMGESMRKGLETGAKLGHQLMGMPAEVQENAANKAMATVAGEHAKAIQARIKAIEADTSMTREQKDTAESELYIRAGVGMSGGQPSWSAGAGEAQYQDWIRRQQEINAFNLAHPFVPKVGGTPPGGGKPGGTPSTPDGGKPTLDEDGIDTSKKPPDPTLDVSMATPTGIFQSGLATAGLPPAATFLQQAQQPIYGQGLQLSAAPIGGSMYG